MAEWDAHKMVIPGSGRLGVQGGKFDTVLHVAHLRDARRILEDGCLRARLVNDGSRLDATRTCVTFFSANTWSEGSIFGNVQWRYDWQKMVSKKNIYWVETKTGYVNPIYRFLVSSREPSAFPELKLYDPSKDDGPLQEREGSWYFNWHSRVSEFLFDGDLPIDECQEFEFVGHHPKLCKHEKCTEKGRAWIDAMAQTMAFVFGCEVRTLDNILQRPPRWRRDKQLSDLVGDGLGQVLMRLTTLNKSRPTGPIKDHKTAVAVVRGALALYGTGQIGKAQEAVSSLRNNNLLEHAIETVVKEHFGIESWSLVEN